MDKKTKMLRIRLTDYEYNLLKEKAEKANKTMSDFVRDYITKGKVNSKCKDLPKLILHLSRIGNNINQLTRRIHQAHNQGIITSEQYDLLLDELMQINNNLKALTDDY